MAWVKHNGTYPAGYGARDRELADMVFNADSKGQADAIARADGHDSAEGAASWLIMRSDGDWVG